MCAQGTRVAGPSGGRGAVRSPPVLKQGRKGQKQGPALLPARHTHPFSSNQRTRGRPCFLNLSHPLLLTSRSRRAGPSQAEPSRLEAEEAGLLQQKDAPGTTPKTPPQDPGYPDAPPSRPPVLEEARGRLFPRAPDWGPAQSPRVCAAPEEVVTTTWREQEPRRTRTGVGCLPPLDPTQP